MLDCSTVQTFSQLPTSNLQNSSMVYEYVQRHLIGTRNQVTIILKNILLDQICFTQSEKTNASPKLCSCLLPLYTQRRSTRTSAHATKVRTLGHGNLLLWGQRADCETHFHGPEGIQVALNHHWGLNPQCQGYLCDF